MMLTTKIRSRTSGIGLILFFLPGVSNATLSQTEGSAAPLCAKVHSFTGEVQVLDSSRTRLTEVRRGSSVGCGSFISVPSGWVRLQHRDGVLLTLNAGSFIEFNPPHSESQDGVTLFKGELYLKGGNGSRELQVLTGNSRVKLGQGSALLSFDESKEETQVLAFVRPLKIENRYQAGTTVQVAPGETSSLDFKVLRVTPSPPAAVSLASVKSRLGNFQLTETEQEKAFADVRNRQDRRFAAVLRETVVLGEGEKPPVERIPAGGAQPPGKLVPEEMFETLSPNEVSIAPQPEVIEAPKASLERAPTAETSKGVPVGSEKTKEEIAEEKVREMSEQVSQRFDPATYARHSDSSQTREQMQDVLLQKQTGQQLPGIDHRSEAMLPAHPSMTASEMLYPDQFKANESGPRTPASGGGEGFRKSGRSENGMTVIDVEAQAQQKSSRGRRKGSASEDERERARLMNDLSRVNSGEE